MNVTPNFVVLICRRFREENASSRRHQSLVLDLWTWLSLLVFLRLEFLTPWWTPLVSITTNPVHLCLKVDRWHFFLNRWKSPHSTAAEYVYSQAGCGRLLLSKHSQGKFHMHLMLPSCVNQPLVLQEMHVGHLRSTIIGETICRALESFGVETVRLVKMFPPTVSTLVFHPNMSSASFSG